MVYFDCLCMDSMNRMQVRAILRNENSVVSLPKMQVRILPPGRVRPVGRTPRDPLP